MRILYHHRTRAEDGQAIHIRALIEAFREEGHEVREVALVKRAEPEGEGGRGAARSFAWLAGAPRFALELAEYGYSLPARRRLVSEAARFEPDFLYERYAFGCTAGVHAARRLGLPIVLEVNSPMVVEHTENRGLVFPRLARHVEEGTFRRATRVCAVSQVLADMLVEQGVQRERVLVTPNGVQPERYGRPDRAAARAALGLGPEVAGIVFGFVGYYRGWHRLDLAVRALAEPGLQHAHLVLVGTGPAGEELRSIAGELGLAARVHFAGSFPHERVPALLAAFDVGLVPAINPYASPLKLFEYLAAGLAVVAPDQPNLREVCVHGENAWLVAPGDAGAMCAALLRLAEDDALRARLGARGRATLVERDLTWRGNARRVVAAVSDLVEGARA